MISVLLSMKANLSYYHIVFTFTQCLIFVAQGVVVLCEGEKVLINLTQDSNHRFFIAISCHFDKLSKLAVALKVLQTFTERVTNYMS